MAIGEDGRERASYKSLKQHAMNELLELGLEKSFQRKRDFMKKNGKLPQEAISAAYYETIREAGKVPRHEFIDYPEGGWVRASNAEAVAKVIEARKAEGDGVPEFADPKWFEGKPIATLAKCRKWAIDMLAFRPQEVVWSECPGPAAVMLYKNCRAPERQFELIRMVLQYSKGGEGSEAESGVSEGDLMETYEIMFKGWEAEKAREQAADSPAVVEAN